MQPKATYLHKIAGVVCVFAIIFTNWDPGATSGMQTPGGVFATNRDGSPDAGDAYFSEIKLMVANADEAPSVGTPAQAGTTWSFESRRHATLWS